MEAITSARVATPFTEKELEELSIGIEGMKLCPELQTENVITKLLQHPLLNFQPQRHDLKEINKFYYLLFTKNQRGIQD
jgi:hypothetical protein